MFLTNMLLFQCQEKKVLLRVPGGRYARVHGLCRGQLRKFVVQYIRLSKSPARSWKALLCSPSTAVQGTVPFFSLSKLELYSDLPAEDVRKKLSKTEFHLREKHHTTGMAVVSVV